MYGDFTCERCGRKIGFRGICLNCREELKREQVLSWSEEEIEAKTEEVAVHAEQLSDWGSKTYKTACQLIDLRGVISEKVQRAALAAGAFELAKVYYHAPKDVRDGLIGRLMNTEDSREASWLMECLAMQGDEKALQTLYELECHPRSWRKKLYVDPSVYAQAGGWTFDQEGRRQELIFYTCYPLVRAEKHTSSPVRVGRLRKDCCSYCGGRLLDMLVVDGREERLRFLGVDGILTATCCPNCVVYEPVFSKFTLDGGSKMLPVKKGGMDMEGCEEDYAEIAENTFVLGEEPVSLFYETESDYTNTLGGFASWVQDWEYLTCPQCHKPMKYLAQLHWGLLEEGEGTLYIEVCMDCRVVGMQHQQT